MKTVDDLYREEGVKWRVEGRGPTAQWKVGREPVDGRQGGHDGTGRWKAGGGRE